MHGSAGSVSYHLLRWWGWVVGGGMKGNGLLFGWEVGGGLVVVGRVVFVCGVVWFDGLVCGRGVEVMLVEVF